MPKAICLSRRSAERVGRQQFVLCETETGGLAVSDTVFPGCRELDVTNY